ncbi:MAG: SDR family NAD(P)-dependent oxidoreductase [Gammaproteobacteria bacterium]|uniref:SDR family NAD(P)-dependent oxidoreductase n=1 Tax=SAR86 cluster bacterium TaxID=2030880 RepID=A0A368C618_9GAMM|nr:MAG: SDR family NAD(P)-dependent oxidoreductase [SAR86 cluster bacterium]RPG39557.1 MAG: SDR family oxidoreductase [Gammaproteobacteria bacterium TMED186]
MGKRLSNKVAIVTGAGSGIGKETSLLFLEEGAQVILADINETTLEETFNIAVQKGYKENVVSIPTNVAKESDIVNMVNIAISEFGHLDILFNNAGVGGAFGSIGDIDANEWDQSMAILLKSVFMGIKHASVEMKKNSNGASIINTASIAGMSGGGGPQAYSAAKAAVINLSQTTALELGEFKIRVNSISPGAISTPLLNGLSEDWDERIKGLQPIEELGQPLDIAYAALFLASDESRFVTGHNLCVDGGLTVDRTGLIKGMRESAQEELGDMRISGMSMGSTGIEETLREIED